MAQNKESKISENKERNSYVWTMYLFDRSFFLLKRVNIGDGSVINNEIRHVY